MNSANTGTPSGGEPFAHLLRFGLARALQAHSDELRAKYPRVRLDFDLIDDEGMLGEDALRVLYHVFVETVANVLHTAAEAAGAEAAGAEAAAAQVQVHYSPTLGGMALVIRAGAGLFSIKDDWARFQRSGKGVMGLKPKLEALGGSLIIHAPEGEPTVIEAVVPRA